MQAEATDHPIHPALSARRARARRDLSALASRWGPSHGVGRECASVCSARSASPQPAAALSPAASGADGHMAHRMRLGHGPVAGGASCELCTLHSQESVLRMC